ncbi:MAG: hypothetical protein ACI4OI_00620 [Gemmiger sp.]
MRSRSGIFWHSLFLTLLLLLPIMGLVLFFCAQRDRQLQLRQAAASGSGVAVEAGAQNTHRLLLVVQQEEPAFVLLRIDAPARRLLFCALPGDLLVNAPVGQTTLADCTMTAGPGRAAQLLPATVEEGQTALPALGYLAATPSCWAAIVGGDTTARIDTSALGLRRQEPVIELRAEDAAQFLRQIGAESEMTNARAAVWEAFARQNPDRLREIPAAVRAQSARILTSLLAQDLTALEDTLHYLTGQPALTLDYAVPDTQPGTGGVQLTEEGRSLLLELLA